tara:strand:- start:529 stop:732 length:204 start_codon:yes stop_codon:yes gene_type:complete
MTQKWIIWQDKKTGNWITLQYVGDLAFPIIANLHTYTSIHDIPQKNRLYRKPTDQELIDFGIWQNNH